MIYKTHFIACLCIKNIRSNVIYITFTDLEARLHHQVHRPVQVQVTVLPNRPKISKTTLNISFNIL